MRALATLPLRRGALAPAPADREPKEPHLFSVREAASQRQAMAGQVPTPPVTAVWMLCGLALTLPRAPGALKGRCLCCARGGLTLLCIRLALAWFRPLSAGGPEGARPAQPSFCPRPHTAPHTALHISSHTGLGVDPASPRRCHNPHRSSRGAACHEALICRVSMGGRTPVRVLGRCGGAVS